MYISSIENAVFMKGLFLYSNELPPNKKDKEITDLNIILISERKWTSSAVTIATPITGRGVLYRGIKRCWKKKYSIQHSMTHRVKFRISI